MFYASVSYENCDGVFVDLSFECPQLSPILDSVDVLCDYYHIHFVNIVFSEASNDL